MTPANNSAESRPATRPAEGRPAEGRPAESPAAHPAESPASDAAEGPHSSNSASLKVTAGPLTGPVLARVVSMMLARVDCPIDRLDDAMLLCDAISAHGAERAADGHLSFLLATDPGGFRLRVGELAQDGARGLLSDAVLPGVGNLLERVADTVRVEPPSDGGAEELVVELSFA